MPDNRKFVDPNILDDGINLVRRPTLDEMAKFAGVKRDPMSLESYERENPDSPTMWPTYGSIARNSGITPREFGEVASAVNGALDSATQFWFTDAVTPRFGFSGWRNYDGESRPAVDVCTLTAEEEAATEPNRTDLRRVALEVENLQDDLRGQLAVEAEDLLGYSLLRERMNLAGPLKRCLAALEIEPLDVCAVGDYKEAMVVYHRAEMKRNKTWNAVSRLAWVDYTLRDCAAHGIEVPEFVLSRCVQIAKATQHCDTAVQFTVEKLADVDPFLRVDCDNETYFLDVWDESKFEAQL